MGVSTSVYVALSVAMFLEYAIWGAWAPVLAARLLGPLKMTGKQTGAIYATLPLASIIAPLIAGWLADQWINTEWILIVAHLIGAGLLFAAARQQKFVPLLVVMFCYSLCYAATLPLVNSVLFAATAGISDADVKLATEGKVFIWAPVAWALIGWSLTGWRMTRKQQGDGSDCLYLAAALSLVMAVGCFLLPATPPAGTGEIPVIKAASMLTDFDFLIFVVISMVIVGLMQFYFLGSAQFMQDMGIASKHVPGSMALAQIAQAIATFYFLSLALTQLGFKWTLVLGAACWLVLYIVYVAGKPKALIIAVQPFHGLAYVFFVIVGQIFAESIAPASIRSSMQALIFTATTGVGLFLGTHFAGFVMDAFKREQHFQWSRIWAVPAAVVLIGVLALAAVFNEPSSESNAESAAAVPAASQTPGGL